MPQTWQEACVLAGIVLASLLWLDLLPVHLLGRAALAVLAWSLASSMLVAAAACWVALKRSRRARG